jgi:hypothetical protein
VFEPSGNGYKIRPVSQSTYYLYANSTQYQGNVVYFTSNNSNNVWGISAVDAAKGRWKLTCGFDLTYNQRNDMLLTNNTNNSIDQYSEQKSLAQIRYSDKKGARVWNIYRHIAGARAYASFVVENGQLPDRKGPYVVLPNSVETPAPTNQAVSYWIDANNVHYQPGDTVFVAGANKTFTAVYRSYRLNYVAKNGSCERIYDVGGSVTLPNVTPSQGFRFLGWASTPNATRADVGLVGDTYNFDKETILYAVIVDGRVWIPISAYSEVLNKECLFTVCGASLFANECYALQQGTFDVLDLKSYLHHGVLKDVPSEVVLRTTNNTTFFYYDATYTQRVLYVTAASGDPQWSTSNNPNAKFYWDDTYKSFSLCGYYKYGTYDERNYPLVVNANGKWVKLDYSVGTTNQFASNYSLDEIWSASKYPGQLTLWKHVEVPVITFDLQGGQSSDAGIGYGFIDHLPNATKAGYMLYGWSDGENIYSPGQRYPSSGLVASDVTLTAVFRSAEVQEAWASTFADLSIGDEICLVIADGNGGSNKFGLVYGPENACRLEQFDSNSIPTYMWSTIEEKDEVNHTIVLKNRNGLYLCSYNGTFRTYVNKTQTGAYPHWVLTFDGESGRCDIVNQQFDTRYLAYSTATAAILQTSNLVDQYELNQALATARSQSKYPKKWMLYKRSVIYTSTVSFDAGTHGTYNGGDLVGTNTNAVILPDLNSLDDAYYFHGWYDGQDTLLVGSAYKPSNDIVLTAVYEPKQAHFIVAGRGTWEDSSTTEKVFVGTKDGDHYKLNLNTLPKVIANADHRFIGWSTNPNSVQPMYTSNDIIIVDVPTTYYAVLMQYVHDISYELADVHNPIHAGDSLILLAEDGVENGLCYAWQTQATSALSYVDYQAHTASLHLRSVDKNNLQQIGGECHFFATSSSTNIFQLRDKYGNKVIAESNVSIDNAVTAASFEILPLNHNKGVYSIRKTQNAYSYVHYFYNSTYSDYYARPSSSAEYEMIDQIDHHITLSAAQVTDQYHTPSTYPYAWTIYRLTDRINYRVTLKSGEGIGADQQIDCTQITLPIESPFIAPEGQDIRAWYDEENDVTYSPGQLLRLSSDLTLVAQYASPQVVFVVGDFGSPVAPIEGPVVNSLPTCTTPETHKFLGWSTNSNATSAQYAEGERYPQSGSISSNAVLYAVIQERERNAFFELVTSDSQLTLSDKYVFAIQDGNTNGNTTKALSFISPSSMSLQAVNWENKSAAETFLFKLNSISTNKEIAPSTDPTWYLCVSSKAEATSVMISRASDRSWVFNPIDQSKGLYTIDMNSYHMGYAGGTDVKLTATGVDQISTKKSLNVVTEGGQYAIAWNLYRYTWTYTAYGNFIVQNGSIEPRKGGDVVMPLSYETPAPDGKGLDYWLDEDGITTYQPGSIVFVAGADKNFTAVYRPYRLNYVSTIGEVEKDYDLSSPAILPNVEMPTGYRFLGWATTNNAQTPNAGLAGDEYAFADETTLFAVYEQMALCDKYVKSSTREQEQDYIIAFEDGDGGPNAYALTIVGDSYRLEALDLQNPNSDFIFRVQGNTLFRHEATNKNLAQSGGSYPSLSTSGGYGLQYNHDMTNDGWSFSFSAQYSGSTYYVSYASPEWMSQQTIGNTVDQWAQHKSLAQVRSEDKYPRNITLYRRTTGLAYIIKYVTYPGSFALAQDEACYVYLPEAAEMPAPYSTHFIGWATTPDHAADGIVDYVGGAKFEPTSDMTFYAVYENLGPIQVADQFFNNFNNAIDAGNSLRLIDNVESDLVVSDGKNITLDANGKSINGTITVKQGGVLNLTATTAANACYIEATSGKSGQIKNADLINSSNIYVDIQLESTKSKADGRKWYGFAVPFNVDPTSGITNLENTETTLTSGVDFYIAKYSGTQRAATRDGWQYPSTDMLVPGQFYMITIDGSCNVWRFKKANGATKFASSELALSAYPSALGIGEANWNAMGNPCLEYSNISSASTEYGYIYNNATSAYTAYRLADYSFVVGCPIFLQAEGGTMVLNHTGIQSQLFAPERSTDTRDGFKVMLSNASTTDNLYVTAAADAMPTYQTGKDVVKLGNALPMLWTEAYGMKLAAENAVLMDDRAEYDLHFYAPSAGIFTLSAERFMGDKQLDLYYAGQLVCTLSESPYILDLQRGFNAGYRLVIHTPVGVSTDWYQGTESVDSANKFIQDNQLYIRINGVIYNAIGAIVK